MSHGHYVSHSSLATTANLPRTWWRCLCGCICRRSFTGRNLYRQGYLEILLLHQHSSGRSGNHRCQPYLASTQPEARRKSLLLGCETEAMDPIRSLLFFPGVVCPLLAIRWGGTTYAWNSARIIVLLVLFGVLCLAFVGAQIWKASATIPRLVKERSIASSHVV
jgi:hypothetical protein